MLSGHLAGEITTRLTERINTLPPRFVEQRRAVGVKLGRRDLIEPTHRRRDRVDMTSRHRTRRQRILEVRQRRTHLLRSSRCGRPAGLAALGASRSFGASARPSSARPRSRRVMRTCSESSQARCVLTSSPTRPARRDPSHPDRHSATPRTRHPDQVDSSQSSNHCGRSMEGKSENHNLTYDQRPSANICRDLHVAPTSGARAVDAVSRVRRSTRIVGTATSCECRFRSCTGQG